MTNLQLGIQLTWHIVTKLQATCAEYVANEHRGRHLRATHLPDVMSTNVNQALGIEWHCSSAVFVSVSPLLAVRLTWCLLFKAYRKTQRKKEEEEEINRSNFVPHSTEEHAHYQAQCMLGAQTHKYLRLHTSLIARQKNVSDCIIVGSENSKASG